MDDDPEDKPGFAPCWWRAGCEGGPGDESVQAPPAQRLGENNFVSAVSSPCGDELPQETMRRQKEAKPRTLSERPRLPRAVRERYWKRPQRSFFWMRQRGEQTGMSEGRSAPGAGVVQVQAVGRVVERAAVDRPAGAVEDHQRQHVGRLLHPALPQLLLAQ